MRLTPLVLTGACLVTAFACNNVETVGSSSTTSTTSTASSSGGAGTSATSDADASSASTGGGAPDIGLPSDTYPAAHPAPPQVVDLGGDVLQNPEVHPILFASDDAATVTSLEDFTSKIMVSNYWGTVVNEYNVGAATTTAPIVLDEPVAASITDAQIQTWLATKLEAGDPQFPTVNPNTLYVIYYPAGVSISLPDGQGGVSESCVAGGFGGYHSSLTLDAAHGSARVAYAVLPRCSNLQDVTSAASHELVEASTDPYPLDGPAYGQVDSNHIYWEIALSGGEIGDMCAFGKNADVQLNEIGYVVQRMWSNKSIKASHDPCVPNLPNQVYFNAVPVLSDSVNLGGGLSLKAVKIPLGQSKTIDVKLFSDGDTSGPWQVSARDFSMQEGTATQLDFSFDVEQGQNGQTLHLTIKALKTGQNGIEIFSIGSMLGNTRNRWYGVVTQ